MEANIIRNFGNELPITTTSCPKIYQSI